MDRLIAQALDVFRGVWHRRWAALAVAWILGLIGIAVVFRFPQNYEATAKVYVDTQTVLKPLMQGLTVRYDDNQQVGALSRTLITPANIEKLVETAKLRIPDEEGVSRDRVLESVAKRLSITGVVATNLYTLSFRDPDPEQAKRAVDTLLNIFMNASVGDKRADSEQARKFIEEQIKTYEQRLEEAEDRVKQFKLKNVEVLGTEGRDYAHRLDALSVQRDQARLDLRAAQQSRDAIKRELAGEDPVFLPEQGASGTTAGGAPAEQPGLTPELDARIDALRKNLDELLRRYTDDHPDVIGTRRILAQLEDQRREEQKKRRSAAGSPAAAGGRGTGFGSVDRNPVYQRLKIALAEAESEVASAKARNDEFEAQYARLSAQAKMVPQIEAEFVQLNRDYEIQKKNYEALVGRRESAVMSSSMEEAAAATFRVIEPPRVSQFPVTPNRLMLLPIVLLAALGLGLLVSVTWSQLQPVFHDGRTLRQLSGRPLLGTVSMLPDPRRIRIRRWKNYAYAGAVMLLIACFGGAFLFTFTATRVA